MQPTSPVRGESQGAQQGNEEEQPGVASTAQSAQVWVTICASDFSVEAAWPLTVSFTGDKSTNGNFNHPLEPVEKSRPGVCVESLLTVRDALCLLLLLLLLGLWFVPQHRQTSFEKIIQHACHQRVNLSQSPFERGANFEAAS